MPIYEYLCSKCGHEFDLMRSITQAEEPASCPQCGSPARKLVSVFASKADYAIKVPRKEAFRGAPRETSSPSG